MDPPVAPLSRPPPAGTPPADVYAVSNFESASQSQILRSHQRDTAQIYRLIELVSEILRSLAGTQWLRHKKTLMEVLVKSVYLYLTFGRGRQTLGEEYTDILPFSQRRGSLPSLRRRLVAIIVLILPTLLVSPSFSHFIRHGRHVDFAETSHSPRWPLTRRKLASFLESPVGQTLPELHTIAFLFRGRFFEFGRRLTGLTYISTLPPRQALPPSYEPLGLLLFIPFLYRHFAWRQEEISEHQSPSSSNPPASMRFDIVSDKPPEDSRAMMLGDSSETYDTPNTYLTAEAIELPERQCTLCLEPRGTGEGSGGTVAVTECGHIFCWGCLGGLEKLECPLCRQSLRMERLVAAYNL